MTFHSAISYARPEAPTRSQRSVEYDLLAQVTQRLRSAWASRTTDFPALVRAVTDNMQLWSTLASDVALPGNTLPAALRARLFYLYEFTVHHSRAVLDDKASVEVLTDINMAVMRGLRGEGGGR
ncbi:flagellar biosynthesis regulator FlaF [Rhodobacter calidifons]|uniref:Flagellar biosynthesis regulator FlaF n=1 Tax=Rhodobacter calidifons TaxID=2715277 RepID=A0ABX0G339_9RHOB|nr:flagellar biosynthesis regulator FlaF [Rhodobacter calidifons]NHB75609.1 flagellar biosynthesis regulator FlaF [Rhodobacter calidifons]